MNQENILKTLLHHYSKDIVSIEILLDGGGTTYIVIDKLESGGGIYGSLGCVL